MTSDGSQYPDHRGAAQFMRTQNITPDDIVLAEDVLQQTYYLGQVDYWLIGRKHSWRYLQDVNGRIQDFYTGTAVIDTGESFEELLAANPQRRIFVIGSGENTRDGRREMRGKEIFELLKSDRFETLYIGHDNFTKVWRATHARRYAAGADAVGHRERPSRRNPDNGRDVGCAAPRLLRIKVLLQPNDSSCQPTRCQPDGHDRHRTVRS